jgi:hypothetical protein
VSTRPQTAPAGAARLQVRLCQLCPGFVPAGTAICTKTSTLILGHAGTMALARQPINPRPFWQARARHEITAYSVLAAAGRPPIPLARLIAADPDHPCSSRRRSPAHRSDLTAIQHRASRRVPGRHHPRPGPGNPVPPAQCPTPPHRVHLARQLRDLAQARRHLGDTAGQQA